MRLGKILKFFDGTDKLDYRVMNENAEKIDECLSNPNLLDNSNFTYPINQRGVTASTWSAGTYGIDRWRLPVTGNIISMDSNGILSQMSMYQYLDGVPYGETLTLSCNVGGEVKSASFVCPLASEFPTDTDRTLVTLSFGDGNYVRSYATKTGMLQGANIVTPTKPVKWVKLERGSVATPYVAPNYLDEFMKCQHYFQNIDTAMAKYYAFDANKIYLSNSLIVPMRAYPSVSFGTTPTFRTGGTVQSGFTFTLSATNKIFTIVGNKTSHGISNPALSNVFGGTLFISADL